MALANAQCFSHQWHCWPGFSYTIYPLKFQPLACPRYLDKRSPIMVLLVMMSIVHQRLFYSIYEMIREAGNSSYTPF